MPQRRSTFFVLPPFIIGLICLVAFAVTFTQTLSFVVHATRTEGAFVGAVAKSGGNHGGSFLYPQAQFTTPDGRTFKATSRSGSTDQPYADGDAIPVLYDPNNPGHAEIESIWLWIGPLALALFALFFCGIPAIVFFYLRKKSRASG
ncbi:hypothetical protein BWP39_20325 [Paraburkholderia acidicola]|uniref:DUF3592 domain-containing protein n=1 Tax=Paraburkholderia acidicola TaxID=1912599 RepID=A0A2A4ENN0_9BURK|nr:DUF3592 domain-containing protein [Paraburkholderia acidicola]PCE22020.1 hypothetical protein BWP39_20325 [Paraburkholderia acidicola]